MPIQPGTAGKRPESPDCLWLYVVMNVRLLNSWISMLLIDLVKENQKILN